MFLFEITQLSIAFHFEIMEGFERNFVRKKVFHDAKRFSFYRVQVEILKKMSNEAVYKHK